MSDGRQRYLALATFLMAPVLVITAAVASAESQSEAKDGDRQVGAVAQEYSKRQIYSARPATPSDEKQLSVRPPDRPEGDREMPRSSRPALDRQAQHVPLIEAKPETAGERPKQPQSAVPDGATSDSKREGSSPPAQQKPQQDVPDLAGKPVSSDEQSKQAPPVGSPPAPDTEAGGLKQSDHDKPVQEVRPSEGKPENGPTAQTLRPISPDEAVSILGKKVHGPTGEDMGMVVDVLVDGEGKPLAALIDFGGFLGVGTRTIATDWQLLQFRPSDRTQPVLLGLGKEELRAAPEYKPSIQSTEIVAPAPPPEKPAAPDAEK